MATASTWSLWAAVFRPLMIGIGAGLIVALLLYVLGVSCFWLRQKLQLMRAIAGGTDVENRGGNDAPAEGTGHPGGLPSTRGVPNGGVEMGERKEVAEGGESADQLLVSAHEEMEARNAVHEDLLHPLPGGV